MDESFQAANEAEMIEAGRSFAARLRAGDVVALDGDLGAGKTHFCKGLVAGLGSNEEVTSPTFALVQEYQGGAWPVFHFDWYRLEDAAELQGIGWDDYLDEEGVILVEWSEKFPAMLPPATYVLAFRILPDGVRHITLSRR
jgi:tRNA threonylcarbamoyladenosine biosynthesis protein TsaE